MTLCGADRAWEQGAPRAETLSLSRAPLNLYELFIAVEEAGWSLCV